MLNTINPDKRKDIHNLYKKLKKQKVEFDSIYSKV